MNIGFIGAGRIAQAIARGFLASGVTTSNKIVASCAPDDVFSIQEFGKLGVKVGHCNKEVVLQSDISIIAVKPNVVNVVLKDIRENVSKEKLLLSLAMGVTLSQIENNLDKGSRVIRVMPNTPALVQQGTTVIASGSNATEEDVQRAHKLFKSVGTCDTVPEYYFDTITALCGSGPAYIYLLIEGLAAGGVKMGLPWDLAYRLSAQTVIGAGTMVKQTDQHPALLRDNVTSSSGSTAEGLFQLEKGNFKSTIISAIQEATKLCQQNSVQKKS